MNLFLISANWLGWALAGFGLCFSALGIAYIIAGLMGFITYEIKWDKLGVSLMACLGGLGTAIFEEFLCRALIFSALLWFFGLFGADWTLALVVQAGLFSYGHFTMGMYKGQNPISWKGLGLFILGSLLGFATLYSGAIYYGIGIHTGAIAVVSLVPGFLGGVTTPKGQDIIDRSHPVIGTVFGVLTTLILTIFMYGKVAKAEPKQFGSER
jgi:membrane protease YdiL (CAAX protease family)